MVSRQIFTLFSFALAAMLIAPASILAEQARQSSHAQEPQVQKPQVQEHQSKASAANPEEPAPGVDGASALGNHHHSGMVVVIDPETGKLRTPSGDEMKSLFPEQEGAWLDSFNLPTSVGPGDTVTLHLDDRFHKRAIATIDRAGKVEVQHDVVVLELPPEENPEDGAASSDEEVTP